MSYVIGSLIGGLVITGAFYYLAKAALFKYVSKGLGYISFVIVALVIALITTYTTGGINSFLIIYLPCLLILLVADIIRKKA